MFDAYQTFHLTGDRSAKETIHALIGCMDLLVFTLCIIGFFVFLLSDWRSDSPWPPPPPPPWDYPKFVVSIMLAATWRVYPPPTPTWETLRGLADPLFLGLSTSFSCSSAVSEAASDHVVGELTGAPPVATLLSLQVATSNCRTRRQSRRRWWRETIRRLALCDRGIPGYFQLDVGEGLSFARVGIYRR